MKTKPDIKTPISLALDSDVRTMLQELALLLGRSVSWVGNEALRKAFGLPYREELDKQLNTVEPPEHE